MKFGHKTFLGWQKWFAWFPVKLHTGEWIWLEFVERCNWFLNEELDREKYSTKDSGLIYVYREIGT